MTTPRTIRLAVIAGDGIGPEVVDATLPVLTDAAAAAGTSIAVERFDWGAGRVLRGGEVMPPDGVEVIRRFDAALFGAVGHPDVPDHRSVWELIIALRQGLDLYVNLRPVIAWPGVPSPIRGVEGADFVCVRENSEGEYVGIGGRAHRSSDAETAVEVAIHTRRGIERVARHAFELARRRRGGLTLVTKSNASRFGYVLWDEVVEGLSPEYGDVRVDRVLVDAMAARIVLRPTSLDVMVASNLFGDILSDLGAVVAGGLGMAPSANIRPDGGAPGVYEPVHGSAPDIAGTGRANPVACLLSGALLLEHCGLGEGADRLRAAVRVTLSDAANHTPDLGGEATTRQVADAVRRALEAPDSRSAPR
ncbi:MAG TPA: isocitrate/isopropylmalate dehydrogenase family protein [Candidatus Limnocylindria bacterium]|nr:isocitrate/isopropylmalate dehydrogenase family protein [Candidatus Limnocylindria bacterium]